MSQAIEQPRLYCFYINLMKGAATMKKAIEKLMAKTAMASAKIAAGTASGWNAYQPKEPVALKKMKKD